MLREAKCWTPPSLQSGEGRGEAIFGHPKLTVPSSLTIEVHQEAGGPCVGSALPLMLLLDRRGSVGGWKCVLRRSSQGEVLLRHGPLDKRASFSRVTYPSLLPQKQPEFP